MASSASAFATQVADQLRVSKNIHVSKPWLENCLNTQRAATPLTALFQTALFRILASDITASLEPLAAACFPVDIHNATIKERRLPGPIVVQVLDIEDMSKSRWEQIEAIEALERGEGTKGREIIRVVPTEDGTDPNVGLIRGGGPHKLLLQDTKGVRAYGMELRDVEGVILSMNIGSKLVLMSVAVARGVILLEPTTTSVLGGKIETLHRDWKETRKTQLKAAIEAHARVHT